jgi:hypothetical protein
MKLPGGISAAGTQGLIAFRCEVELVALSALVVLVFGTICYLCSTATEPMTAAFIVPSQTFLW